MKSHLKQAIHTYKVWLCINVKEGGVLQRFYDSPAEFHQTLEADRAVWNSSLLKRAPPNMRLRQKKLSLDLIWCEKYSL